jgi:hypothetical protein
MDSITSRDLRQLPSVTAIATLSIMSAQALYPTGLRNRGTKAPAFSVIRDPENAECGHCNRRMDRCH